MNDKSDSEGKNKPGRSKNWLWKREGMNIILFPNLKSQSPHYVNPHTNIGKPFLVISLIVIVYGYFYVTTRVPSYLDFPTIINEIIMVEQKNN